MKVFGLSPAAVVVCARHADAQLVADDGDDFATAPGVAAWPEDASAAERVELEKIAAEWGWICARAEVVSALGLVRAADARVPSVLALDRTRAVTVVAMRGWREWSGTTVAQGLVAAGFRATAVEVQMQGTPVDASLPQMAARFEDAVFRKNLVDDVRGAEQLLFPPVLSHHSVMARLQDSLACPLGEAVATLPSLAGEAQLVLAQKKFARALNAEAQLVEALAGDEPIVIASRRAAAWLERHGKARAGVRLCGRASVRGLGAEWLSALRLLETV